MRKANAGDRAVRSRQGEELARVIYKSALLVPRTKLEERLVRKLVSDISTETLALQFVARGVEQRIAVKQSTRLQLCARGSARGDEPHKKRVEVGVVGRKRAVRRFRRRLHVAIT